MAKTLKQLAKDALAVQMACNLSGVARSFAQAMADLCEHVPGTDARNTHPIAILWIDKMASLAGIQAFGDDTVLKAFSWATKTANEADEKPEPQTWTSVPTSVS